MGQLYNAQAARIQREKDEINRFAALREKDGSRGRTSAVAASQYLNSFTL